tara:strand:- start:10242 stop:10364 length:123 start_codon:yes stop_codon:yes gene_type:complete
LKKARQKSEWFKNCYIWERLKFLIVIWKNMRIKKFEEKYD